MKIRLESGAEISVKKAEDLKITPCYKEFEHLYIKRVYVLHKSFESGFAIIKQFESQDEAGTCKAYIEGAINRGEKIVSVSKVSKP